MWLPIPLKAIQWISPGKPLLHMARWVAIGLERERLFAKVPAKTLCGSMFWRTMKCSTGEVAFCPPQP